MTHPYLSQPDTAKWSRAISRNWKPETTIPEGLKLLRQGDRIASLGSCFAANLVPYLKEESFYYVEAERRTIDFAKAPAENFSYDKFSAAYGNVYTTRQFRQLLDRSLGRFKPQEDRWHIGNEVIDPFRPGLRFRARSDQEFDALTSYHLSRVRLVFETANVVIFTLGLTEAWHSKADGAVFPACPGTIDGSPGMFDSMKHAFHNFTVAEIVEDLNYVCDTLKTIRPDFRMILTVSPVPLVATATNNHVLVASTYSKSVLRVACGEIVQKRSEVSYFPSYEIITGPQAPNDFFEPDRRNASKKGIDEVMSTFFAHCDRRRAPVSHGFDGTGSTSAAELSALVAEVECEEAAADR